jgi:3-isopropylmalate/(R)-2-methylmalate dehydratase small subunit
MTPFLRHTGIVAPLDRDNVDTDAIMPKQFMKSTARTGFGPYLFDEWRYQDAGFYGKPADERVPTPDFVLNLPRYRDASVLLCGRNFGCGSSREHAPWALQQFGFRALIGRGFADIFYNNCFKNGLFPVVLTDEQMSELFAFVKSAPGFELTVDLELQTVCLPDGRSLAFDVPSLQRTRLLEGTDEIAATLMYEQGIRAFELDYRRRKPWL